MKLLRLLPVLCLLATPLAALDDPSDCDNALPHVLNLGLPRLPKAGFSLEDLRPGVDGFMREFYREHGQCYGRRPLQVNVTVASDYEILDWLSQGTIHAAVIPDMTLYLLKKRDGLDLRKVNVRGHTVGDLLLPALAGAPRSAEVVDGRWRERPSAQRDLEEFHRQIWRRASGEEGTEEPVYRLVLASHLSTTGFLEPVLATARWVKPRLQAIADETERDDRRESFWQAFFDQARFTLDCDSTSLPPEAGVRSCWELPRTEQPSRLVEILYPCEMALRPGPGEAEAVAAESGYREHLVIAGAQADEIFPRPKANGDEPFTEAVPTYGAELDAIFADRENELPQPERRLLRPFQSILEPEPLFGARTFGFTVDEAVRLLRQDQATSGRAELSLVLPGGGVKAAYQSRIVDELYRRRYLSNFKVARPEDPLKVRYVIGTSGGALLGFFVSQLGDAGPWNLTDILWKRDAERGRYLRSSDVFGWTDLLRYLSVVVSFLVLCVALAFASVRERGRFNPDPVEMCKKRRLRLRLAVLPLLLTAPLLVRWSNAKSPTTQEQVPEFEGLIYAVLIMIAMYADQCLVLQPEPRTTDRPWAPHWLPVFLGGALIAVPLLSAPEGWVSRGIPFGLAYGALAPLVLLAGLIFPLRAHFCRIGLFRMALETLVPTGLALLLGLWLAGEWLTAIKVPFLITGFALVLLLVVAYSLLRCRRQQGRGWWTGYAASLLAASFLVMNLCWPGEPAREGAERALAAHTLEISVGTFLVCVGLLMILLGGIAWAYAAQPRYHVQHAHGFRVAFGVVLTHLLVVFVTLWVVTVALPDWLSPLELTGEFWLWLLGTSALMAAALWLVAARGWVKPIEGSFHFLCSHHPNGDFVTRRFLRLAALSVLSLVWWNVIVAPALYGNRQARDYLDGAVERFYDKAGIPEGEYRPTSRFIAPANLLERDGTRYFLFVPPGDKCPQVPKRPSNGAIWYPYAVHAAAGGCPRVMAREFPVRVIFASGSPFPIFPAHRLKVEDKDVALVDGGYSNNVPVDAARTVAAEQVLIVESTNPLGSRTEPSRLKRAALGLRGKLVENLGRLPSFLFERSQQMDRLSRRDLFVVSISPSREEKDWPPLFDFRRQTVQRMESVATTDLGRRVGTVQSWGRPAFVLSVEVKGKPREEEPHSHM